MKIYDLAELPEGEYQNAGGKAKGLASLICAGLTTAKGFVIIGLSSAADYEEAADYYEESELQRVAVRSSSTAEDGKEFSNAGQFQTCLNIEGRSPFIDALKRCMASLHTAGADRYSSFFSQNTGSMAVVVQRMVDAAAAGVCFTVDPVTGRRRLLIEAVPGLGESLVSGRQAAQRYLLPIDTDVLDVDEEQPERAADPLLSGAGASLLRDDVLRALAHFHHELDMEWALEKNGTLIWLQARPITTLDEASLDELDPKDVDENTVYTTCNVGEMLPGAVTPLSISTSVRGIDYGMRVMLIRAGAYRNLREIRDGDCIANFSNHLFINLTTIYKMGVTILGAQKESVEASICGKALENIPPLPWKQKPLAVKLINGIRYFSFLFSYKGAMKRIERILARMKCPENQDIGTFYTGIDKLLKQFIDVTLCHYVTSVHSGAMSSTLLIILKSAYASAGEAKAALSGLLEDIDNIESVDILRSLRHIAVEVLRKNPGAIRYAPEQMAVYIKNETGPIREAYDYFIARHGHRSIREAELRMKSWKQDEEGLMETLRTVMGSVGNSAEEAQKADLGFKEHLDTFLEGKGWLSKKLLGYLVSQARNGAYNREFTKSRFVKAIDIVKETYMRLADMLIEAGVLPEQDLIYFFSHEEIGALVFERKVSLIKRAIQRRRLLDEQMALQFNEVTVGKPVPIHFEGIEVEKGMSFTGAPLSRGEVSGIARVVKTEGDARELQEGEIMVASFTDIGWSPYYCVVKGLITEVGSALSHGAVVAREYSLPVVSNIPNITAIIKTGDYISMNGSTGGVIILEPAEAYEETAG
jgi:pyruvate,water dikinase